MYNDNFDENNIPEDLSVQDDPQYREEVLREIELAKLRRQKADEIARDKMHAQLVLICAGVIILIIIVFAIAKSGKSPREADTSAVVNTSSADKADKSDKESKPDKDDVSQSTEEQSSAADDPVGGGHSEGYSEAEQLYPNQAEGHTLTLENGIAYVDGIMIVNKTFLLPEDYAPGIAPEAQQAFDDMAAQAWSEGISLWICSGYRSYEEQVSLFEGYSSLNGQDYADNVSARPGHSEHQSGLCMDINSTDFSFEYTSEAQWLADNCADYGFIIRFPRGKEGITGYTYEPWHIRYVGVQAAQEMKAKDLCLEEYLNVTSDYADSPDSGLYENNQQ